MNSSNNPTPLSTNSSFLDATNILYLLLVWEHHRFFKLHQCSVNIALCFLCGEYIEFSNLILLGALVTHLNGVLVARVLFF